MLAFTMEVRHRVDSAWVPGLPTHMQPRRSRRHGFNSVSILDPVAINELSDRVKTVLEAIAVLGRNYMRETINMSRRRSPETHDDNPEERRLTVVDSLASAIDTRVEPDYLGEFSVGIGVIQTLNQYAPYWALINYGGQIRVDSSFIPGSFEGSAPDPQLKGNGTQSFSYAPGTGIGMSSRGLSTIPPMRYIEATEMWLKANIPAFLSKYGL